MGWLSSQRFKIEHCDIFLDCRKLVNRVDNPTLPSPVKLSRCDNLFRGDQDLGSSLGQPDRSLSLADSHARDFPDAPLELLLDAGRV